MLFTVCKRNVLWNLSMFKELHLGKSTPIMSHTNAPSSNWGCQGLEESGYPVAL